MAVLLWSHRPTRPLAMSSLYMSRNSGVVKDGPCSRPIQRHFGPCPINLRAADDLQHFTEPDAQMVRPVS